LELERVAGGLEVDSAAAAWRPGELAAVDEVAPKRGRVDEDDEAAVRGPAIVPNHMA
jgi:hypothetical protein